ncbi:mechanosensitive ion channel [Altererythrobacter salegens]|uniref:Small-conductance mechanosensitive channel n=1 Tax=Croceibacterium salegens TaxID=1737568 RepID=A0A6I4SRS4_9SPHN|nr:mechanosensitive ion channel domain-containing protein [Croceibacterium salegens]MXO58573.1 mechanosensitive ion channel [Croceibacterium salegens]
MLHRYLLTFIAVIGLTQAHAATAPDAIPSPEPSASDILDVEENLEPPSEEAQKAIEETVALESDQLAVISLDELSADVVPLTREELAKLAEQALTLAKQRTVEAVNERKTNPRLATEPLPADQLEAANSEYDEKMIRLVRLRGAAFDRLNIILDEWEEKGGDPDLIKEYRDYQHAVQSDTVSNATIGGAWAGIKIWATSKDGGLRVLKAFGIFLLSVLILLYVARLIRKGVSRSLSHTEKISTLLQTFISLVVYWVVLLLGLALIIASLGFDVTPVFALLGGASFILAFALQETLGNFAAGMMILVYRPFDQGERIVAAGVEGDVHTLNLTSTILVTPDHQLVTIPNAKVWNDVIINAVDLDKRRVDLAFIVKDPQDVFEALSTLPPLLLSQDEVLKDPAPEVYLGGFDGRGAEVQVRPWVVSTEYRSARRSINLAVLKHFTEKGIALWVPPIEEVEGV